MANVWTPEEDARLKELYDIGTSAKEMAAILDRPKASVSQRISKLGFAAAKRAESSTPIPPKPDPVEPVAKRRYKIRYLVDGIEERTTSVTAKDERTAKAGLLKELDKINDLRTYEIIRVEDVELVTPDPEIDEKVKKFAEILDSVNEGVKSKTLKAPEIVKEIQDGIDEVVQLIQEKEDELMQCKDGVCEMPAPIMPQSVDELKAVLGESVKPPMEFEVYFDMRNRLHIGGVTFDPEETKEVLNFCEKMKRTMNW